MWLFSPKTPRKVIVDVDAGTDDAWALFMLLRAMKCGLCDIVAITCVYGNTTVDNVAKNVLRVLSAVGQETCIPVYKGCAVPLLNGPHEDYFFHGVDGFGDLEWETAMDESLIKEKNAVTAIYDLVQENPQNVELIFLGPLTNLAVCCRTYGEQFVENVKSLHIMGGNFMGEGNITKSAEFNFFTDPEAAQIVLETLKCPIQILPWETCTNRVLNVTLQWRLEVLGALDNEIMKLMNALDDFAYVQRDRLFFKPVDALLVAVVLCPQVSTVTNQWNAVVELQGKHTRGQMVVDHLKRERVNVLIVENVDQEIFKQMLLWTAGHSYALKI